MKTWGDFTAWALIWTVGICSLEHVYSHVTGIPPDYRFVWTATLWSFAAGFSVFSEIRNSK